MCGNSEQGGEDSSHEEIERKSTRHLALSGGLGAPADDANLLEALERLLDKRVLVAATLCPTTSTHTQSMSTKSRAAPQLDPPWSRHAARATAARTGARRVTKFDERLIAD